MLESFKNNEGNIPAARKHHLSSAETPSVRLVDESVKKTGRGMIVFFVSPVARPTPLRPIVPGASLAMLTNSHREAARKANVGLQPNGLHTIANPAR